MKHRSLIRIAVFSIITFGIYQIFWLNSTRQELVKKGHAIPTILVLFIPIFAFLGGLIAIMTTGGSSAIETTAASWVAMALVVAGLVLFIPVYLYWFYKYCKAAEKATNGEASFDYTYSLLIILNFLGVGLIWPILVQNAFNKTATPAN